MRSTFGPSLRRSYRVCNFCKRNFFASLLLILSASVLLCSCGSKEQAQKFANYVCFVASSDVDGSFISKAVEEISGDLEFRSQCITNEVSLSKFNDVKSLLGRASSFKKDGCVGVVAIVNSGGDPNILETAIHVKDGVAILNLWEMTEKPSGRIDIPLHRVVKETTRALGRSLGLEDCPFPACAMKAAFSIAELDNTSRGPCPPCREKIRDRLLQLGCVPPDTVGAIPQ